MKFINGDLNEISVAQAKMLHWFVNTAGYTEHQFSPCQYTTAENVNYQGHDHGVGSMHGR